LRQLRQEGLHAASAHIAGLVRRPGFGNLRDQFGAALLDQAPADDLDQKQLVVNRQHFDTLDGPLESR
jgi:hypothetical protein